MLAEEQVFREVSALMRLADLQSRETRHETTDKSFPEVHVEDSLATATGI